MIRFVYWSLVILEVILLLGTLLLFIVTDSRTIKYIADSTAESTKLTYRNIEGNLFDGLYVTELRYDEKPLFASALVYWNPLTLFYNKITITQIDAQGIEMDNVLALLHTLSAKEKSSDDSLEFAIALNASHFDINPFVYEGVKFSNFVLQSGKIQMNQDFMLDTGPLYLKFDSDIVNFTLNGQVDEGILYVEEAKLEEISSKEITKLSKRLHKKYQNSLDNNTSIQDASRTRFIPIKQIVLDKVLGTLKAVQYGDVKIQGAQLELKDAVINPQNNFVYQAKTLDFKGQTNFGDLSYKGLIQDSTINAQGMITLDRELFKRYQVPLNYLGLKKLPSSLRLTRDAFWIDVENKVKELLVLQSDFNLDVDQAQHHLHYDYETDILAVQSQIKGKMDYADNFVIENDLEIKDGKLKYKGTIEATEAKALSRPINEYLIPNLNATYEGTASALEMTLENELLTGSLKLLDDYENLEIRLKSKKPNIRLGEFLSDLEEPLASHSVQLSAETQIDLSQSERADIVLDAKSNMIDLGATMKLKEPYSVDILASFKDKMILERSYPKFQFGALESVMANVLVLENNYEVRLENEILELFFVYNDQNERIEKGFLALKDEKVNFRRDVQNSVKVESKINNTEAFLENLRPYITVDFPSVKGELEFAIELMPNGIKKVQLKSPKLIYLEDINIYHMDLDMSIDSSLNIVVKSYDFKLDDNGYLNTFNATKNSFLAFDGDKLKINKLWLHDTMVIDGEYDVALAQGALNLNASQYTMKNKDFTLVLDMALKVRIENNQYDISGNIDILGETLNYELGSSGIIEDADIVIVNQVQEKKKSFWDDFKLYVKIQSKKPILFRNEETELELMNDLLAVKNFNQKLLLTGTTTIKQGWYQFEDKRFVLDKSHLYFTGDLKKPFLDLKANLKQEEYNVYVFIAGTTDAPIVNFSADPFLTQQQIMSLILFDGTGSSQGTGAEAYTILGGTFAKGLIKSLGIDVDYLILGQNEQEELSLEVGNKINEDISILYLRKDGLDGVKVKVEHSDSFDTDIIIQPPNTSSIEFLYKKDR